MVQCNQTFGVFKTQLQKARRWETSLCQFSDLSTDEDRVNFMRTLKKELNITIPRLAQGKNAAEATRQRVLGNKCFASHDVTSALRHYTASVVLCPSGRQDPWSGAHETEEQGGEHMALALANRSAALLELGEGEAALSDISASMAAGYPAKLRHKLLERRAKCLLLRGQVLEASEAVEAALEALDQSELDASKRQKLEKNLAKLVAKSQGETRTQPEDSAIVFPPAIPSLSGCAHPQLSSACAALQEVTSDDQGRHLVANRDIEPGEVLTADQPYAWVLIPSCWSSHCSGCSRPVLAPVPCGKCAFASYCSTECRKKAELHWHSGECNIMGELAQVDSIGLLALRMAVVACKEAKTVPVGPPSPASPYYNVWRLVTHQGDREAEDLMQRVLQACVLLEMLQRTTFLDELKYETQDQHTQAATMVGCMILRHLQIIACNAHEITEFKRNRDQPALSCAEKIGEGIYPIMSLFNHSCDPDVTRAFHGVTCVTRAIKPVAKGCQVYDNYGAVYAVEGREERHGKLRQQYRFTCACKACDESWPLYPDIPETDEGHVGLKDTVHDYQTALQEVISGDYSADYAVSLCAHISAVGTSQTLPSRHVNNAQEALKQIYAAAGNCGCTHTVQGVA